MKPFLRGACLLAVVSEISLGWLSPSFADRLESTQVSVLNSKEISSWARTIKDSESENILCRETSELPNAFICLAKELGQMNSAFIRASMYTEGVYSSKVGKIEPIDSKAYTTGIELAGGHDLKAEQLSHFYQESEKQCATNRRLCLSASELSFKTKVFDLIRKKNKSSKFVIIASTIELGEQDLDSSLSHEFLHALYFLNSSYRDSVRKYWNELRPNQKTEIRKELSATYDSHNEDLMINEFQAYILMKGAEESFLKSHLSPHHYNLSAIYQEAESKRERKNLP